MKPANAILNTFYLILFSILVFSDLRYRFRKRASKKWPSLQARIESVTVRSGRASALFPELKLTYAYFVDGIRYTGFFFLYARDDRKWFHQDLTGKSIVIRYDTRRPGISFLSDTRIWGKRVMQGPYLTQRLGDR